MNGFVFIDKQAGYTSTSVDNKLKGILHTKKVGHIGTLDPFATGLLIIGVGKGTKSIAFFDDFTKEYIATIKLGVATDSMDLTGKEIDKRDVPYLSKDKVVDILNSFLGKSKQLPPMTSAISVNGQKLYKLAHQGKEVDRPLRDIEVFDIELIDLKNNELTFRAMVSKGTYIRVLGSDIANKLGTVGHLSALRRTKVGPFDVKDAVKLEDISDLSLKSTYDVLKEFSEVVKVNDNLACDIKNGKVKYFNGEHSSDRLLIVDNSFQVVAMYVKNKEGKFEFARGLF